MKRNNVNFRGIKYKIFDYFMKDLLACGIGANIFFIFVIIWKITS